MANSLFHFLYRFPTSHFGLFSPLLSLSFSTLFFSIPLSILHSCLFSLSSPLTPSLLINSLPSLFCSAFSLFHPTFSFSHPSPLLSFYSSFPLPPSSLPFMFRSPPSTPVFPLHFSHLPPVVPLLIFFRFSPFFPLPPPCLCHPHKLHMHVPPESSRHE